MKKTLCWLVILAMVVAMAPAAFALTTVEAGKVSDIDGYVCPVADGYTNYHFVADEAGEVTITTTAYVSIENYTTGEGYVQLFEGESGTVPVAVGDVVRVQTYYNEAEITLTAVFTAASGEGEGDGEGDVIDTSVLEGSYNVDFYGMVLYELTFADGVLTVVDNNTSALTGSYNYVVGEDGAITVTNADGSDSGILIGIGLDGSYTFQCAGLAMAQPMVKVANAGDNTGDVEDTDTGLAGDYIVDFYGMTLYELNFTDGVLTVVDNNTGALTGSYNYVVAEDGSVTVTNADGSDSGILISMDLGGNYTFQCAGLMMPQTLVKVEASEGGEVIEVPYEGAGTNNDPYILDSLDDIVYPAAEGQSMDLYYQYTAPAGGVLTVNAVSTDYWGASIIMTNLSTYAEVYSDYDGTAVLLVDPGDVIIINIMGAGVVTASGSFVEGYPEGSEKNPGVIDLAAGVYVELESGTSYYATWTPTEDATLLLTFANASFWGGEPGLMIDGVDYFIGDSVTVAAGQTVSVCIYASRWGSAMGTVQAIVLGPVGSENNPEVLESIESVEVPASEGDYYYTYTTYVDGTITLTLMGEGASATVTVVGDYGEEVYTSEGGVLVINVQPWDEVSICVNSATASFTGVEEIRLGSSDLPIVIESMPTTITNAAGADDYYLWTPDQDYILTVTFTEGSFYCGFDTDYESIYDEEWNTIGYTVIAYAGIPVSINAYNWEVGGTAELTVEPYEAPEGSKGKPIVLDSVDSVYVEIESGSDMYYVWTATQDGEITFTVIEHTWFATYQFSAIVDDCYFNDMPTTLYVTAGQEVIINLSVGSWNESGSLTFTGVYAGEEAPVEPSEPDGTAGNPYIIEDLSAGIANVAGSDLYYQWTAPANGTLYIDVITGNPLVSGLANFDKDDNGNYIVTVTEGEVVSINPWNSAADYTLALRFVAEGEEVPPVDDGNQGTPPTGDMEILFVALIAMMSVVAIVVTKKFFKA